MKARQEFDYSHFKNVRVGGDIEVSGNGIDLVSAVASSDPQLNAVGDDTNVSLRVLPKGTGGFGYATGAGGTVTQATSITTGVTLNKICGEIVTVSQTVAAGAEAEFTVTNSTVAVTDVVVVCIKTHTSAGEFIAAVSAVAAGSFNIRLTNLHATTAGNNTLTLSFAVIKAVAA